MTEPIASSDRRQFSMEEVYRDGHPYPHYAWFRAHDPVHVGDPGWPLGRPQVTLFRYGDVTQWLKDPRMIRQFNRLPEIQALRAQQRWQPPGPDTFAYVSRQYMLFQDPPEHTRLRALANRAFTSRLVADRQAEIEQIAADLLAAFRDEHDGEGDLLQAVANPLPMMVAASIIGIPLGVVTARSDIARAILNPILDLMQTIPSFVYLIPAAMLFGLGKVPAILATVIYATPPLIRLTDLGIRQVDREVVEASRAFGATRWQMLKGVQIPLALPSIMQGINQTTMMALAMVVIASMIGARGIGETVLLGLQRNDPGKGLVGGIGIVILAIIFDRISQAFGRRLQAYQAVRS